MTPPIHMGLAQHHKTGLGRSLSQLFPTPKILVGKSQQSSISHSYLLENSGSQIRIKIQYLSIWTLVSLRPNTYEFWTFAPTIAPQNFGFSLSSKEKKQGFDFYDTRSHDSSIHTCRADNSRTSDLLLTFRGSQSAIKCSRRRVVSHIQW